MLGKHMTRAVATECNASPTARRSHKNRHARQHAFQAPAQGFQLDLNRRILPEQNMMLEINRGVGQLEMQNRNKFALDVINDAAELFFGGRSGEYFWNWHKVGSFSDRITPQSACR